MSNLVSSRISVAALVGLLLVALAFFLLRDAREPVIVSDAVPVKHSDVADAPEAANVRTMVASYYANILEGEPTAGGGTYQPERLTAAHKTLPLGTEVRVSYGGEAVEVVVNDRGPFVEGRDIDLSLAAAREIGLTTAGTAPVRVTVL